MYFAKHDEQCSPKVKRCRGNMFTIIKVIISLGGGGGCMNTFLSTVLQLCISII